MAFTELNVNGARVSNVGTPTGNTDAANKQYVDEHGGNVTAGNGITVDSGTVSVKPKTGGGIIVDGEGVSVDAATMPLPDDAAPTNDPTFTGSVTVPDPTADTDATNKEYVDGAISAAIKNVKVPTAGTGLEQTPEGAFNVKAKASGGIIVGADGVSVDPDTLPVPEGAAPTNNPTFTGNVTVPTPANDTDAATKGYVDQAVAGIDVPEYTAGAGISIAGNSISVNKGTMPTLDYLPATQVAGAYAVNNAVNIKGGYLVLGDTPTGTPVSPNCICINGCLVTYTSGVLSIVDGNDL